MFSSNKASSASFLVLVLLSLAMVIGDLQFRVFNPIRPYLTWLVTPIQVVVSAPQKLISWADVRLDTREALVEQNQQLNSELLMLRGQLQRLTSLRAENVRLRELLDASQRVEERVVMAEVIGFDQNAYSHKVLIDKGFSNGAYIGQPVLDATGVLGQVVETSAYTSRVLLIADASHFVPVQLPRTGFRSILRGTGDMNHMELMSVPHTADIKKGDILSTSGLANRFPIGYPVGIVRNVRHVSGKPYADVEVVPMAQLNRSRHVMLIERSEDQRDSNETPAEAQPEGADS
ncbi:rod shape-determining protein MreC [Marinomonas ostreistagni]|uniref:rod shape-determining protein MreC n=1 Tax=Marinomonas ostreistagni TaxID=359209 RepID=UPI00194EEB6A|nr:rod shape-determining protein MreC [Marinomonas ostreistagni]